MSLKDDVVGVLLADAIWEQPHFTLSGQNICGCDLAYVGVAVREGRIGVRTFKAKPGDPGAYYAPKVDRFYFRWSDVGSITRKGLVVHEAVHAALDLNKATAIRILDSEAIAYVHQCFYLFPHAAPGERMLSETPENDKVWAAAWAIAKTLREGGKVSDAQIAALRAGVKSHRNYRDEWADKAEFDGVPEP